MIAGAKLLLDECVSLQFCLNLPKNMQLEIVHTVDIRGLGFGASDTAILQHIENCEYDYFVTADRALIRRCLKMGIKVAKYQNDRVYALDSNKVIISGKRKPFYKIQIRAEQSCEREIRRMILRTIRRMSMALHKRRKAILRPLHRWQNERLHRRRQREVANASRCNVCGLQCRSTIRLRNHLKNDHYANLINDPCKICFIPHVNAINA